MSPRPNGVEDRYQRKVHSHFAICEQPKAELDGLRVLAKARVGGMREDVVFVVGFEMPVMVGCDVGVVGEERLLRADLGNQGDDEDEGKSSKRQRRVLGALPSFAGSCLRSRKGP